MKKIYSEYAELKAQEKELKQRIAGVNKKIVEDMLEKGEDKIPTEFGNFILKELPSWEYSDEVEQLKVKLVKRKEFEEETGIATKTTKPSLTFSAPKAKK